MVGGVVLFARNFDCVGQLRNLTRQVKALRNPPLPIAVDHEGGRVQRFKDGFTRLPAMADIGALQNASHQQEAARAVGVIIAYELRRCGIDMSFVPVLDLAVAGNLAIGTRAFAAEPAQVTTLGIALADGLNFSGYPAVAKHFPGHGSIVADSHFELPHDERSMAEVLARDALPFHDWARAGSGGIMTAHIRFPAIDEMPVTFSAYWLKDVLRGQLGFDGVIFSDDLGMQAARQMGTAAETAVLACGAGCDVVLVCNDQEAAVSVAEALYKRPAVADVREVRQRRLRDFWETSDRDLDGLSSTYEAATKSLAARGLMD
jgi:beta-N-acetylhexosaminidase